MKKYIHYRQLNDRKIMLCFRYMDTCIYVFMKLTHAIKHFTYVMHITYAVTLKTAVSSSGMFLKLIYR